MGNSSAKSLVIGTTPRGGHEIHEAFGQLSRTCEALAQQQSTVMEKLNDIEDQHLEKLKSIGSDLAQQQSTLIQTLKKEEDEKIERLRREFEEGLHPISQELTKLRSEFDSKAHSARDTMEERRIEMQFQNNRLEEEKIHLDIVKKEIEKKELELEVEREKRIQLELQTDAVTVDAHFQELREKLKVYEDVNGTFISNGYLVKGYIHM